MFTCAGCCLRHFVELTLKDTIRKFKLALRMINSNQLGLETTHDIFRLFEIVEGLLR